ncbi:MAG TPA: hypothetical protein VL334_01585, partial [Anaerolineae bacterium]|nr:hypothetical protein [Anaerolineae bacterium]
EWSIAGKSLPDLPFLYGPEYAAMHASSNKIMRDFVEGSQAAAEDPEKAKAAQAETAWGGAAT